MTKLGNSSTPGGTRFGSRAGLEQPEFSLPQDLGAGVMRSNVVGALATSLIVIFLSGCQHGSQEASVSTPPSLTLTEAINSLNFIQILSGSGGEPGNVVRVQPQSWAKGVLPTAANISTSAVSSAQLDVDCAPPVGTFQPTVSQAGSQSATASLGGKAVADARFFEIVNASLGANYANQSSVQLTDIQVEEINLADLISKSLATRQNAACRAAILEDLAVASPVRGVCLTRRALKATVEYTIGTSGSLSADAAAKISADIAAKLGGSVDSSRNNVIKRPNAYIGIDIADRCSTKVAPRRIETFGEPDPAQLL